MCYIVCDFFKLSLLLDDCYRLTKVVLRNANRYLVNTKIVYYHINVT